MYCFRRLVTLSIDGDPSCYLYFDFIFAPVYGCARSRWIIGRCSPEGSIVLLEETCRRQPARGGRAEAAERISPDRRRRRVSVPALRADRSIGPAREGRPRAPPPPEYKLPRVIYYVNWRPRQTQIYAKSRDAYRSRGAAGCSQVTRR